MSDNNPFQKSGLPSTVNAGTVAIEQERAIAEAQGKLVIAKRFPRDQAAAYEAVMESCKRPAFAEVANYAYPRGGQQVTGPSIRMAEELARCWGNMDFGIRELSRRDGVSEMEAYAWDLQTNTMSSQKFTVKHLRDKTGGATVLTSERDIYEVTANMGGRRLRARILSVLPPDLVDAAVKACRQTMAGKSEMPIADRVRQMIDAFAKKEVSSTHIASYLDKPLDAFTGEDIADMQAVYNAIHTGQSKVSDFFGAEEAKRPNLGTGTDKPKEKSKPATGDKKQPAKEKPKADPKQAAASETQQPDATEQQTESEPDETEVQGADAQQQLDEDGGFNKF